MEELVKLWEHQKKAVQECRNRYFFSLLFEQGTGKTATAINILREKSAIEQKLLKTLIITPLITLNNWKKEIEAHSKIREIVILTGSQKKRIEKFNKNSNAGHIFIINHEFLAVMPFLLERIKEWSPEFLIVDEMHRFKDGTSKRTKQLIKLSDSIKYRFGLTGTPVLNSPLDLFAQFRIVCGGFPEEYGFEKNYFSFRAKYFYDKNSGMPSQKHFPDWQIKPGSLLEINKKIYAHSMRITKEECLDLPDEIEQVIEVELSDEQRKLYEEMRKDFIAFYENKACVATLAITKALRLQQIASGFIKTEDGIDNKIKRTPRQEALKELLETITKTSKVIVWAVFKENYQQIKDVCVDLGLQYVEVHGEIPNKEKFENVEKFNADEKVSVFIGHPNSGGIGINLVSANYSIFFSRSFSLGDYLQAKARNHRGGQTKKVTHIHLVSPETIDEEIQKSLASKLEISDKVLYKLAKGTGNNGRSYDRAATKSVC